MGARVWIDVEDLFRYAAAGHRRPSGIQRVAFELASALQAAQGDRVGFVRHHPDQATLQPVPAASVVALHVALTRSPAAAPTAPARQRLAALPPSLRAPLARTARGLRETAGGLADLLRAAQPKRRSALPPGPGFEALAQPGDTLAILGSPWFRADYDRLAHGLRDRLGLRLALLVHDLIPIRHPEWCRPGIVEAFIPWMARVLPECDVVLANSRFTAADATRYAEAEGIRLPGAVHPIRMASGLAAAAATASDTLPPPGTYVLAVGTLEPRKNHALLLRVWRRLLAELPPARVPLLVLAGSIGWGVDDLLHQLHATHWLDGHIRLFSEPADTTLAALYRGCLFTVFPSFYEGWGLPVTESLGFGKPCLAANTAALPEAGGDLVRYFDPDSATQAAVAVREVLDDPAGLHAWAARIRAEFHPVSWADSARDLAAALGLEPDA